MASSTGFPPLVTHTHLPSMAIMPGMADYDAPYPGPPASFSYMPGASLPMQNFGGTLIALQPLQAGAAQHHDGTLGLHGSHIRADNHTMAAAEVNGPCRPPASAPHEGLPSADTFAQGTPLSAGHAMRTDPAADSIAARRESDGPPPAPVLPPTPMGTEACGQTSAARGSGCNTQTLCSPDKSPATRPPKTPPALKRTGRRARVRRPRITSVPTASAVTATPATRATRGQKASASAPPSAVEGGNGGGLDGGADGTNGGSGVGSGSGGGGDRCGSPPPRSSSAAPGVACR
eukprot:TRINITY_DN4145_c1_g1_i1.p1 TRINITY_DN4145_c1_g1~~TRINITY_DN4145_c1_g1_i1.p1  ORF type:complete len:290 (-),score=6.30 TRINITY_DN4145_c1_g1_i1:245-1114(-)